MGEYSSLNIGGHHITGWKNCISMEVAILFTEDDYSNIPQPGWADNWIYEEGDERLKDVPCFQYVSTASIIIERLELLGYTLARAEEAWNAGVRERYKLEDGDESENSSVFDFWQSYYSELPFKLWISLIKQIIEEKIEPVFLEEHKERGDRIKAANSQLHFILTRYVSGDFGFPSYDSDLVLRAMLELLDPDIAVVLDCSTLDGWVSPLQYICEPPKAVILTEGTSDQRIIQRSLQLLYPHFYGYFSFPDFEATNLQGSTGQLINIVKAFVATGIRKKTLVIFDNDTAGHDAIRVLSNISLPQEIRAFTLPPLDLAQHYPTIGPQGSLEVDINGVACSIELYLGRDILEEAGKLCPVRYSGFVPAMGRWQGEITKKQELQNKYLRLLDDIAEDPAIADNHDWSGVNAILETIFNLYTEISNEVLQEQENAE